MKIIYTGRSAKGRIIPTDHGAIVAKKGEPVEVPDAIAEGLLKTPDWSKDEPKPAAKATKKEV